VFGLGDADLEKRIVRYNCVCLGFHYGVHVLFSGGCAAWYESFRIFE
jgi:hypothetical protein